MLNDLQRKTSTESWFFEFRLNLGLYKLLLLHLPRRFAANLGIVNVSKLLGFPQNFKALLTNFHKQYYSDVP